MYFKYFDFFAKVDHDIDIVGYSFGVVVYTIIGYGQKTLK